MEMGGFVHDMDDRKGVDNVISPFDNDVVARVSLRIPVVPDKQSKQNIAEEFFSS